MNTLKVGIATAEEMKQRTLAIARGELKASPDDPKVWFTSPESFARVLSNKNRALLEFIAAAHPESLQELAAGTGRAASNLSRTLRTMERYGFVHLHKGPRGQVRPEVPYREITLVMPLAAHVQHAQP
ncbi:MAG: helix-turn-helix domain-containing protein [Geminicoccaceae bacterium]